ncbi:MAG: hypothetical protein WCV88_03130 [Patescibacteria group bacterium]|jgi:hypothetical protein
MDQPTKPVSLLAKNNYLLIQYFTAVIILAMSIGVFSLIMMAVVSTREDITASNYDAVSAVYNGSLTQTSPSLAGVDSAEPLYDKEQLNAEKVKRFVENTSLTSTSGQVDITADYVKKGLTYQPTYRTKFSADYVLSNTLAETAAVSFRFPFPSEASDNEISNATLSVDGKPVSNAKTTIKLENNTDTYDYYYPSVTENLGLEWNGEIPANGNVTVHVTYNTVGLAVFTYEGIDNPKGSQDFHFIGRINGIRSYDVAKGLSVDQREFGANYVQLTWDKPDLYSKPTISIAIGDKVNPSLQVSRVYVVMAPIFVVFIIILLFLVYQFGSKPLSLIDLFLLSILYTLFFPLFHYLSSFTIDPTIEVFANITNVPYFSMPLYGAFVSAWVLISALMLYLVGRVAGGKFSIKFLLPMLVLFMGFFPLVVTIPEYSILLALVGVVALMVIVIQSRLKLSTNQ